LADDAFLNDPGSVFDALLTHSFMPLSTLSTLLRLNSVLLGYLLDPSVIASTAALDG